MSYLFALVAGGLVVLSMVMNARIARSVGIFAGAFSNFAVGFLTSGLVVAACYFGGLRIGGDAAATPWYAYSGALFGIAIVASCNVVIPRISVVYSAVLIFLGQIVTGLILDAMSSGVFDLNKSAGALLVAAGLLINAKIDANKDTNAANKNAGAEPASIVTESLG